VLTLIAVLFPVMLLDVMWGMSGAMQRNIFDNTTQLQTGHIQIHVAGYEELKNTLPLINDVGPILDAIADEPAVSWSTVRLELPALVAHDNRSRGVLVQGVEPGTENVNPIDKWISEGRNLLPDDKGTAIAGLALLDHLETSTGETLILITAHPQTGTGVLVPEVVGVIDPPAREVSRAVVQVPLADARNLIKNDKAATNVVVLIEGVSGPWDQQRIDEAAARLQASLGDGYVVETWKDLAPETVALFNIIGPLYLVFAMIFFVLAGLVVLNTLYLSVLERTRELGVILALGSSRKRVLGWIEVESIVLAGLGAIIGTALGSGLVWWGSLGFDIPGLAEDIVKAVGIEPTLYLRMTFGEAALSAAMMFVIALLAAAYPGWKASRLEPVEAMRFAGN
jgi:ABC-type lipoprotein release transport system permease subunit